jgi:hypothetical protein
MMWGRCQGSGQPGRTPLRVGGEIVRANYNAPRSLRYVTATHDFGPAVLTWRDRVRERWWSGRLGSR